MRQQFEACLLAALCSVLFLGAGLLPGRALVPFPVEAYDVQHAEAVAAGQPVSLRGNLSMGDKYGQSLCWDRVLQDRLRSLEIPLWTKDIGGGASFVPQMAQVYQPWNLLLLAVPSEQWYGLFFLLHQVLLGFLGYRFFRRIGCGHEPALLGVVVAVIGLWTQCKLHHNVILTAALSLFPMLSAVHALCRERAGARTIGALGLWAGLSWLSGFAVVSLQVSYLTLGYALLLALGNPRGARLPPLLRVGAGFGLGAVLAAAQMLPVLQAAAVSARAAGDPVALAARGLEWDYALTLLWPDLMHQAGDHIYSQQLPMRPPWLSQLVLLEESIEIPGFNWVECSFAIGLPALLAACVALADRARRGTVVLFAAAALFGFGLSTGSDLFLWPARALPMLTGTDLKRNLFLCAMALSVLAAIGADRLQEQRAPRGVVTAMLAFAGLSLALWVGCLLLSPESFTDTIAWLVALDTEHAQGHSAAEVAAMMRGVALPDEAAVNLAALRATFLRATLIAAAAAAALGFLRERRRGLALVALTATELLHAGHGTAVAVPADSVTTPPRVVQPVLDAAEQAPGVRPRLQRLGDPTNGRVGSLYLPNLPGFHGIEDAAAYHPLPPRRMEEFFLCIEPDEPGKVSVVFGGGAGVGWLRKPDSVSHPLLDLFGVRFLLADAAVDQPGLVDRTPADTAAPYRLYERTAVLPRATFVRDVQIVTDRDERLGLLARRDRDVAHTVILEDQAAPQPAKDDSPNPAATVTIRSHRDERVVIDVRTDQDGYLRLHDPWDAGWRALVNGEPTPLYIADHYLRAVYLPPGRHEVVFTFDAEAVRWPIRLSGLGLIAILWLLLRPRRERTA